ncbi:Hypothetical predicted protein [Lecanosticta acicola]|uniref:F-box domain-containing protein n=1 Tax=Lecanosticta acicola TaxID=111012 RepID=A0AAI8Z3J4_9PEZI|nr:Hypothetical predicted protein [Lecanosticta acicola]
MANVEFLDLPREVRDMVYLYFRGYSWIDITQMPDRIHQPSIAKVSRKVRKECLDVFYGKNRFMLDMRGWKNLAYPATWTPNHIFEHWIAAIGDVNAARLRNVSFYVHNFAVHFTISHQEPRISAKFRQTRTNTAYVDLAEEAPTSYSFELAIQRARARIEYAVMEMTEEVGDEPLTVKNIRNLCDIVESIKPALCTRMGVGWKGAIFPEDPSHGPHVERHREACAECAYFRITAAPGTG